MGPFLFPLLNGGEITVLYCFFFLYLVTAGAGPFSLDGAMRISLGHKSARLPLARVSARAFFLRLNRDVRGRSPGSMRIASAITLPPGRAGRTAAAIGRELSSPSPGARNRFASMPCCLVYRS